MSENMAPLVGETIVAIYQSSGACILEFETKAGARMAWQAVGDCCANAYFHQLENFEWLIGEEVLRVEHDAVSVEDTEYGQTDTEVIRISTRKGTASIELRTEHNGYYGGWAERIHSPPMLSDAHRLMGLERS